MFLCREKELGILNKRYRNNSFECAVIYGRRRIGKTALINEFVSGKKAIYYSALKSTARDNLIALSKAVYVYSNPDALEAPEYPSFDAALSAITYIAKKEKVVLVIDELPYLAEADESILSRLQHYIDHEWANTELFLILCGSSVSFMENKVLSEKSPLFGRRTCQLKIEPLTYLETAKFNPDLSPVENAMVFAITGGVPHYINKLDIKGNNNSITDALKENFFDPSAYLFEEPGNLLRQELREPSIYNSIITAIANGNTKLGNIANATGLETSSCVQYINKLTELGIISKIEPVVDKSKRKTQYRITDQFFRFWYRFVPVNNMSIVSGNIKRLFDAAVWSYMSQYMGLSFEVICLQYLTYYAENLPFVISDIGEWWGSIPVITETGEKRNIEAQLDIVAVSKKPNNISGGNSYIIGSCKYTNDPVGIDELGLIRTYAAKFTTAEDSCHYWLFSKSGFSDELTGIAEKEGVILTNISDMFDLKML